MKRICGASALIMILSAGPALAVTALPPGSSTFDPLVGSVPAFDTVLPAYFSVPANQVAPTLVSNYVGPIAGAVTSNVYVNPGTGFLAFEYVFTNTTVLPGGAPPGGSVLDLAKATIGDPVSKQWLGWTIFNCGADGSGTSTALPVALTWSDGDPYSIDRDLTAAGEGLTINWKLSNNGTVIRNPSPGNPAGDWSAHIFFETDAKYWTTTSVGLLDSGVVSDARAYAPSLIPEPASLSLLGLGGLALLLKRRRRS